MKKITVLLIIILFLLLVIGSVHADESEMNKSSNTEENIITRDSSTIEQSNDNIISKQIIKDSKDIKTYNSNNYSTQLFEMKNITYITSSITRDSKRNYVLNLELNDFTPERNERNILILSDDATNKTIGRTVVNHYGKAKYTLSKDYANSVIDIEFPSTQRYYGTSTQVTIPSDHEEIMYAYTYHKIQTPVDDSNKNSDSYAVNESIMVHSQIFNRDLSGSKGTVTYTLNNQTVIKKNITGRIIDNEIKLNQLGLNTIEIYQEYDFNYANKTLKVYINPLKSKINLTLPKIMINKTNKIMLNVYDEFNNSISDGKINIKVNNEYLKKNNQIINYTISNGKCNVDYFAPYNIKYKLNNFTVLYTPTNNYISSSTFTTYFIPYPLNGSMLVSTDKTTATMGQQVTFTAEIIAKGISNSSSKVNTFNDFLNKLIKTTAIGINPAYSQPARISEDYNPYSEISRLTLNEGVVIFKINGVTVKDQKGNPIKTQVKNNTASLNFTIPDGWSAKPIKITAVYSNKYFDRIENKTYINLTKILTNITFKKVAYKNNTLSVVAHISDKNNHTVLGRNVIAIKINGITIKRTKTKTQYYVVQNGSIKLNLKLNNTYFKKGINTIHIVTGDRNAYLGCRNDYRIKVE